MGVFILFYYKQVLGLSGTLTGLAIAISIIWDGISDRLEGGLIFRSRSSVRMFLLIYGEKSFCNMVVNSGGATDGCKSKKVSHQTLIQQMYLFYFLDQVWMFLWARKRFCCHCRRPPHPAFKKEKL